MTITCSHTIGSPCDDIYSKTFEKERAQAQDCDTELPGWFRKEVRKGTSQKKLRRMILNLNNKKKNAKYQMMLDALLSTTAACAEAEPHVVGAAPVACNDFDMTEEDYAHLGLD